ncbi:MAG: phosphatase PAP2 family protein [Cypionkella sp.]
MRFALLAPAALALAAPAAGSERGWQRASDVGVWSLTAWSIGVPAATGDGAGALQAAGSIGGAYLVASGLKEAIPSLRPDLSDDRSFPSGHTARAFGTAVSIFERRGAAEGIPALAVAGFVGLARVEGRKHRWRDILAGAAVGTGTGLLVTRPLARRRVALAAWGDGSGAGASLSAAF